jgi:cytochrome c
MIGYLETGNENVMTVFTGPAWIGDIVTESVGRNMQRLNMRKFLRALNTQTASSVIILAAFATAGLAGAARADGDPAKGKAAFVRQCALCHTAEKGGDNRYGPNLFGIVGRKAGTVPGFSYSNAFKTRADWEWTEDAIGGWMRFPATMVPGTAMAAFQGIAEKDRDDLVAYLATLK